MLNYKKKLLDRYPATQEKTAPLPPQEKTAPVQTPPENFKKEIAEVPPLADMERVKAALRKELAKDSLRLLKESWSQLSFKKKAFVALIPALFALMIVSPFFLLTQGGRSQDLEMQMARLEAKIPGEVRGYFNSPKGQELIRNQIRESTDETLRRAVSEEIQKNSAPLMKELEDLTHRMKTEGEGTLQNLNDLSAFMSLVARAKNDDRPAFEELLAISRDRNHSHRALARDATLQIFSDTSALNAAGATGEDYPLRSRVQGVGFQQVRDVFQSAVPIYRPFILQDLWDNPQVTRFEKMNFLAEVIRSDKSLRVLQKACALMDLEAGLQKPFTVYESYLTWWEANKDKIQKASS